MSGWLWAVIWLALAAGLPGLAMADNGEVKATAYCIMDADTGKILAAQNHLMLLPPASTLKVGTALIALQVLDLHDRVPVSVYAASAPASKIHIRPGEVYTVKDMLYAILLASANDCARALAERVSGSEERFAQFMTRQLRERGAYRTSFQTASGLPAEGQFTTAYDLALIFRQAMQNPVLAQIMSTKTYTLANGKEIYNHNRFLFTTPLAVAGKTGYTRASKHTYVGMFQNGEQRIIVAMLGSSGKWADLRTLIAQGFAAAGTPIAALPPVEETLRRPGMVAAVSRSKKVCRAYAAGSRAKYRTASLLAYSDGSTVWRSKKASYKTVGRQKKKYNRVRVRSNK